MGSAWPGPGGLPLSFTSPLRASVPVFSHISSWRYSFWSFTLTALPFLKPRSSSRHAIVSMV